MAVTYDDTLFRTQFPEFSDVTKYPVGVLSGYFTMATLFISADGSPWTFLKGAQLAFVLNAMTAHLLTLGLAQQSAATPGSAQGGFEVSSSIGEINVSVMAPPVKDAWDFWLYQTPYGQMLMAMLSVIAVGGFSVGGLNERSGFRKVGGVFF
jgi:hypothetical protein